MQILLSAILILLVFNVAVAIIVVSRRMVAGSWLLILLLVGTTGAGSVAVLSLLVSGDSSRFVDIGLIFTALAAVSAVAGVSAHKRRLDEAGGRLRGHDRQSVPSPDDAG